MSETRINVNQTTITAEEIGASSAVDTMPIASVSNLDKIYQYVGDITTNIFCTVTDSDLDPYPTITIDYTKLKAALDTQGVVLGESGGLDINYEVDAAAEEGAYIPVISVTDGEAFYGETYFSTPEEAFASVGIVFSKTPLYVHVDYTIQTFSSGYFYKCIAGGIAKVEEYVNAEGNTPDKENIPTFIFDKKAFDKCIKDQGKPANTGTKVKFSYWFDQDEGYSYVKAEYNSEDFILSELTNDYGSEMNATFARFGFTTNFCPVEEREATDEEWNIIEQQMFDNGYIIVSLPTYSWNQINVQPTSIAGKGILIANNKISVDDSVFINNTDILGSIAIGINSTGSFNDTVAVGHDAKASSDYAIAIGGNTNATAAGAIQLGSRGTNGQSATNSDADTFKVGNANGNFEIMSADGTIPEARLADTTNAQQGDVLTLDSTGNAVWQAGGGGSGIVATTGSLLVANWDPTTHSQTITVTELTATKNVLVSPAPASTADYIAGGIICSGQLNNTLTFTCTTTPSADITVNMMIFD